MIWYDKNTFWVLWYEPSLTQRDYVIVLHLTFSSPPPTNLSKYIPLSDTVRNSTMKYGTILNSTVRCNATRSIRYDIMQYRMLRLIWYSAIRHDLMRWDAAQCDTIRYNTIWYDWYGTVQYNMIRYDTTQSDWYDKIGCDGIQYGTIRYDTICCDAIGCRKIRYDTVWYKVRRYGTTPYDLCKTVHLDVTVRHEHLFFQGFNGITFYWHKKAGDPGVECFILNVPLCSENLSDCAADK